jgi:allantoin racemase
MEDDPTPPMLKSGETTLDLYQMGVKGVRKAVEAEARGFNGVILGVGNDAGVVGAREAVRIPVVGPCEASLMVGAMLGYRCALVTVLPNLAPTMWEAIRRVGLAERVAAIRTIGTRVLEARGDRARTLGLVIEQGQQAVRENGADTVILAGMTLAFLDEDETLRSEIGVPVVNPLPVAVRMAELLVSSGLTHSKAAYLTPTQLSL